MHNTVLSPKAWFSLPLTSYPPKLPLPLYTQSMILQKLEKTISKSRDIQLAGGISYEILAIQLDYLYCVFGVVIHYSTRETQHYQYLKLVRTSENTKCAIKDGFCSQSHVFSSNKLILLLNNALKLHITHRHKYINLFGLPLVPSAPSLPYCYLGPEDYKLRT